MKQTLDTLTGAVVLLGSQYDKAVYLCHVIGIDHDQVWVRYPRNSEGVAIERGTFTNRLRRVLHAWDEVRNG